MRRWLSRAAGLFTRSRSDRDLADELNGHLDASISDNVRAGMSATAARRDALIRLGGVAQAVDAYSAQRRPPIVETTMQDLRYALRMLRRSSGFAAVAVMSLALGIGANTAIFSAVDAILIRPLPYTDPGRLVIVWEDATAAGFPRNTPAPGNYFEWVRLNRVFTGLAATAVATANLTGGGPPEQLTGRLATPNFFAVLGAPPVLGRTFTDEEDRAGAPVIVISYGLWQRRFGGDPAVVGSAVLLNNVRTEVVGIMPRPFVFRNDTVDYWAPIHVTPELVTQWRSHYLNVVARLRPGVSVAAADADMRRVSEVLQRTHPEANRTTVVTTTVIPIKEDLLGRSRIQLLVLMGASAAVLLIACANLASLLLARSVARRGEIAVRIALGATRGRLLRQFLIEGSVLSVGGGMAGLLLAAGAMTLLSQLAPQGLPPIPTSVLDLRLLAFTIVVSLGAGLVFSIVPAWQATRVSLRDAHQQGARANVGGGGARTRDVLVVMQVAAAVVLLVSAGLLLRTFANLRATELGFRPDHLLTMRTSLSRTEYREPAQRLAFYDRMLAGVRALPGVESAAYTSFAPFDTIGYTNWYQIEGVTLAPDDPADALIRVGTGDYLATLGVRMADGRMLDGRDVDSSLPAVVVNETMARKYWPRGRAVGQRLRLSPDGPFLTIVGVVRDVRERGYELQMKPAIYRTVAQAQLQSTDRLVVRVGGDPMALTASIRQVVASINPAQPVAGVRTMDDIVDANLGDRRQQMRLLAAFAALALGLAAIGLYGVLAYGVAQRTREFGVRMALGASRASILRIVLARGAILNGAGLLLGLAMAWAVTRTMSSLMYGIDTGDPSTFAAALVVLAAVGVIASVVPARHATGIEAMDALRNE
jgi:putative ABC transport system permease protein